MKILLVLAPTLGMAANVLGHLAITWFSCRWGVYGRMGFGAIFGAAATMTIAVVASLQLGLGVREAFAYVAFDLATMLTLAFGYFNLVQMNISSLRLRIANELIGEPDGVPAERLFARYSGREIVDARLERLSRAPRALGRRRKQKTGDACRHTPRTTPPLFRVRWERGRRLFRGRSAVLPAQ